LISIWRIIDFLTNTDYTTIRSDLREAIRFYNNLFKNDKARPVNLPNERSPGSPTVKCPVGRSDGSNTVSSSLRRMNFFAGLKTILEGVWN
jgi:hypothetical protein